MPSAAPCGAGPGRSSNSHHWVLCSIGPCFTITMCRSPKNPAGSGFSTPIRYANCGDAALASSLFIRLKRVSFMACSLLRSWLHSFSERASSSAWMLNFRPREACVSWPLQRDLGLAEVDGTGAGPRLINQLNHIALTGCDGGAVCAIYGTRRRERTARRPADGHTG